MAKFTQLVLQNQDGTGTYQVKDTSAVAFDEPQTLTLAQQAQARANIGAAQGVPINTVTGSGITVNDVYGVKHGLDVKVSGVADPTSVIVFKSAKNLIDVSPSRLIKTAGTISVTQEEDGVVCRHSMSSGWPSAIFKIGDYSLFVGRKFYLNLSASDSPTKWIVYINSYDAEGNELVRIVSKTSPSTVGAGFTVPENSNAAILGLRFETVNAATAADVPCKFPSLQLEFGDFATSYETPKGIQEATPAADGTVSGLTSVSPTMNIITSDPNAMLEVTYNQASQPTTGGEAVTPVFDYTKYGLPILYLNGDTSAMTKDDKVTLRYTYGSRSGSCTAKWQGSSSVLYPKKNYTVTFDASFEAADGWGSHDKYCLKADWVDFSHCRNVVAAKLWGTVVKSRAGVSEKLSTLPNGGAIDGFPCLVVINDKLTGIYNFTIPKEDWLMGMGEGTQEAYVCAEGTTACGNWNAPVVGTDFDLEYVTDEDNADWVQTSLNALFAATNAASVDEAYIDNTLSQYVDINSAIDYYVFAVLMGHDDGVLKNYILSTYDGTKWFWSAYDMDLILGLKYSSQRPVFTDSWTFSGNRGAASFAKFHDYHKLMRLLYRYKKPQIIARYKELRHTILSPAVVAQAFYEYASKIALPVYNEEASLWNTRPNTSTNNVEQIVSWYQDRVLWLDKEIAEMEAVPRVEVVKFVTTDNFATLRSTSHTAQQIRNAIANGNPVMAHINAGDADMWQTALCWVDDQAIFVGCSVYDGGWNHTIGDESCYVDGDASNKTMGNELWVEF